MAQTKPFTWYGYDDAPAFAGMKADNSVDVCDSFASEGGVNPGDVVVRGTDTQKQCKVPAAVTSTDPILGIAVHVHREPPAQGAAYYEDGYVLPVMSFGDIYVVAGGDVKAGDPVAVTIDKGKVTYSKGTKSDSANTIVPGLTFLDDGAKNDLVRVRVRV